MFRTHLRRARRAAGLSQTEVAHRLTQTQLFVSRSEIGDRKVDVIELRAFCKAIGVPFVQFVTTLDTELEHLEESEQKHATG